jgi:predicted nucleotidyltransferase
MTTSFNPAIFDSVFPESYPLLFVTISGAHLYGFPSPDSDYDLRGVHILPIEEVVGLDVGRETIEVSTEHADMEIDLVTHDAHKFFLMLLKKNGYVLEQLYSPLIVKSSPEHEELKSIARKCITRHHVYHYRHFAETQWELLEKQQPPTAKALLYVYRVLLTGTHLMQTGEVEANLAHLNEKYHLPYIEELIRLKTSSTEKGGIPEKDLVFHRQEFETLQSRLTVAAEKTSLPDKASARPQLHDLLVRLRRK